MTMTDTLESRERNLARTNNSVLRQLAALQPMTLPQLQEKWRDLYGSEPPQYKKQFLIIKLAYRIQEILHGGLTESTKNHIKQTAKADKAKVSGRTNTDSHQKSKDVILPGTRFIRHWQDQRYEVIALEKGFEYEGKPFRSLTAVAKEITGTHWNGRVFFGLNKKGGKNAR